MGKKRSVITQNSSEFSPQWRKKTQQNHTWMNTGTWKMTRTLLCPSLPFPTHVWQVTTTTSYYFIIHLIWLIQFSTLKFVNPWDLLLHLLFGSFTICFPEGIPHLCIKVLYSSNTYFYHKLFFFAALSSIT